MEKWKTIREITAAWLAILALLMTALAPALSQTLPGQSRDADALRMQICSAEEKISALSGSSDPVNEHGTLPHCAYCLVHGDIIGPPQSVAAAGSSFFISYRLSAASYQSASHSFAWTVASSRAPPVVG